MFYQVDADAARLLAPTESSQADPAAEGTAFKAVHGYTTDKLMQDQRFKVMEALGRAGLRGTRHAQLALAAVKPMKPVRLDTLTSHQRQQQQQL